MTPRAQHLQRLAARLVGALTARDVSLAVLEEGLPAMGSDAGSVVLLEGDELVLTGVVGFEDHLAAPWRRFPLSASAPLAEAARTKTSIWIETPDAFEARYARQPIPEVLERSKAWVALPLVVRDITLGALGVTYPQPHTFDEADRRYGETLAHLCAQALERAHLFDAEARTREALQETQARLEDALASSVTGTWRYDPSMGEVEYGGAFGSFHGLGDHPGRLLARQLSGLVCPEDRERAAPLVRAAVADGGALEIEYRVRVSGQPERWLLSRGHAHGSGSCRRLAGTVVDITAHKQAETRLREVNAAQRRFVSDAAHELRAPLTAIRGNLELLRRFPAIELSERLEMLDDAVREATRLTRLITDLLALARGEARQSFVVEGVALERVLEEVWRSAQALSNQHTFKLGRFETCRVNGDPDGLKQVAFVLLENAVKYTPPSGVIQLSLEVVKPWAEIRVTDSGVGIDATELPHVFERFFRSDRARSRSSATGGSGLGLTIARQIVEAHGGTVHLESRTGVGTTAVVRLPTEPQLD